MRKKFLSVLLTLAMVLAMVPATALADVTYPEPVKAIIHDVANEDSSKGEAIADEDLFTSYDATYDQANKKVTITAEGLKPHWNNANPKAKGAWVGIALVAPDTATHFTYAYDEDTLSTKVYPAEENVTKNGDSGVAFYFDASKAKTGKCQVQWYSDATTTLGGPQTYTVDMNDVQIEEEKVTLTDVVVTGIEGLTAEVTDTDAEHKIAISGEVESPEASTELTLTYTMSDSSSQPNGTVALKYENKAFSVEPATVTVNKVEYTIDITGITEKTVPGTKTEITDTTIALTAPAKGAVAQTVIDTADKGYTTAISWDPTLTDGKFAADQAYTATITLTADQAHKFKDGAAIIVTGQTVTPVTAGVAEGTLKGTVTFPKTAAEDKPGTTYKLPVPEKAILSDRSGTLTAEQICENYDVTTGTAADGVIPVTIKADKLRKHENASEIEGFYIGFALAAPDQEATKVKYVFAVDKAGIETVAEQDIELEINAKHEKGVAFYSNLSDLATAKKFVKIQWLDKDGNVITIDGADTFVYEMNFASVTKFEAEVAVAPPAVEVKEVPSTVTGENKTVADAAHTAIASESAPTMVADAALQTAANDTKVVEVAATVTPASQVDALKEATNDDTIDEAAVKIVVQPYLDIEVKDASTETVEGQVQKTLTVQITPMYRVVATTADVDNGEEVKIDADALTNAVVVDGKGGKLDSVGKTEPVEVKIPLGTGFVEDSTIYVDHFRDDGTYVATYEGDVVSNVLTFTNPHGFSVFKAKTTDDSEVKIGDVRYSTLKAAVAEVKNGETITLLKSPAADTITVSKEIEFTINGLTTDIKLDNVTIKADTGFELAKDDETAGQIKYTFTTEAQKFDVTVNGSYAEHSGAGKYTAGTTVTVKAGERSGYKFTGWTATGVTLAHEENVTVEFIMPANAVTLTAGWEKVSSGSNNGGSGHGGSHSLDEIKGGRYDNLPKDDEKPVIGSDDVADPSNPFVDVATSDPYYDAIMEVYKRGWMVGISDNTFASSGTLTRGMAAQILWNKAGNPAPASVSPFLDVTSDKWYATAIAWAYEQGLVLGYDGTTFGPDDFVTTEQFTIMLDKLAGNTPAPYVGGAANATRGWVANEIVK